MTPRPLVIVAAVGRNGAIGRDNRLPWSMPGDLAHFKARTSGTPMIMGRRTFQSIGRALPGRESIVVSRDVNLALPEGVFRAGDPVTAYDLAQARAMAIDAGTVTLIGGATLFKALLSRVDALAMTFIDLAPVADTFFPAIDHATWRETKRDVPRRHEDDEAACVFVDYTRRPETRASHVAQDKDGILER